MRHTTQSNLILLAAAVAAVFSGWCFYSYYQDQKAATADQAARDFDARIRRELEEEMGPEWTRQTREAEEIGEKAGKAMGKVVKKMAELADKPFPVMKIPDPPRAPK